MFSFGGEAVRAGWLAGVTAMDGIPEPPTTGHVTCVLPAQSMAEGTILSHFLCKVTLEASTQMPAALGAKAHSQNGAVSSA